MLGALQTVAGILLIFVIPGYLLVNLIFPRRGELDPEYDQVYRLTLGMGLSVVIAIFIGFILNAASDDDTQYVRAGPLWIALSALGGLFLLGGWLRGAYPSAGLIHPSLYRPTAEHRSRIPARKQFENKRALERLILERKRLVDDLKKFSERSSDSNPQRRLYYRKRMDNTRARVDAINAEMKKYQTGGE